MLNLGFRKKPPIVVDRAAGAFPDDMDRFRWTNGFEDPKQWEAALVGAYEDAKREPELAELFRLHLLEEDVGASFEFFRQSTVPHAVDALLGRLGVTKQDPVADVGCGRAHAAYALHKLGYERVTAMDPNSEWHTGTGYLASRDDHNIRVVNDLAAWRGTGGEYGAVVSSGTVHHWQHIPQVAIDTRRVLRPGGYWLMISEFFANTSRQLLDLLNNHPTSTRYNTYEWAYPASVYVDLVQTAGLLLVGVIPLRYKKAAFFAGTALPEDEAGDRWVDANLLKPNGTVEAFWNEVDRFRRGSTEPRNFTEAQVLIFRRVEP
jgi:SAM-dependent methyltransferase